MKEHKIYIDNGEETEDLIQFLLNELSDAEIDNLEIDRKYDETQSYAGEPLTTAALLGLATTATIGIIRIIERWLEYKKQERQIILVIEGFKQSDEAGKAVSKLAENNNKVSIEYKLTKKSDLK
ncbi:hypothetical protein [Tenacibaculum amylolyticum]|uniref:hypothetical protein n=1 Tax=Tenacibaculum amylolyticum TaxID=104269 RepID=UPI0038934B04